MIKIFKIINRAIRSILNILIRLLLLIVYFILFLPFGIWAYFCSDFLVVQESMLLRSTGKTFPIPLRKSHKVIADHAYGGSRQRREGDFLDRKKKSPYWIANSKIEDVANFLRRQ